MCKDVCEDCGSVDNVSYVERTLDKETSYVYLCEDCDSCESHEYESYLAL